MGLEESSQLCAQSLFVRSKPSPLRTWLQKWKRDSWTQHLYGRILNPSRGKVFETEWTSLLEATPANHSPQRESEQERMTQDTCGLGSQTEFGFCDQKCASLKMSKDTSRWDSPASLATWKSWVTRCRGEYSLRVKLAHRTSASGCLSWPTTSVAGCVEGGVAANLGMNSKGFFAQRENGTRFGAKLRDVVLNWPTANARDWKDSITGTHPPSRPNLSEQTLGQAVSVAHGLPAPANHSTNGSRQESSEKSQQNWQTFAHGTHNRGETPHRQVVRGLVTGNKAKTQCLTVDQVFAEEIKGTNKQGWRAPGANKVHPEITEENREQLATRNKSNLEEEIAGHCGTATGKLNPRWVETLMGLPIGWTMPKCTQPVTIELTNCDCLETESCQQLPSEHLEPS